MKLPFKVYQCYFDTLWLSSVCTQGGIGIIWLEPSPGPYSNAKVEDRDKYFAYAADAMAKALCREVEE